MPFKLELHQSIINLIPVNGCRCMFICRGLLMLEPKWWVLAEYFWIAWRIDDVSPHPSHLQTIASRWGPWWWGAPKAAAHHRFWPAYESDSASVCGYHVLQTAPEDQDCHTWKLKLPFSNNHVTRPTISGLFNFPGILYHAPITSFAFVFSSPLIWVAAPHVCKKLSYAFHKAQGEAYIFQEHLQANGIMLNGLILVK